MQQRTARASNHWFLGHIHGRKDMVKSMKGRITRRSALRGAAGLSVVGLGAASVEPATALVASAPQVVGRNPLFDNSDEGWKLTRKGELFWTTGPVDLYVNEGRKAVLVSEFVTTDRSLGSFESPLIENDGNLRQVLESIGSNLAGREGAGHVGFSRKEPGAYLRTVESKSADIVSAFDFLPEEMCRKIRTNQTDASDADIITACLQAALNRLGSQPQQGVSVSLYLPDGTYWVHTLGVQGCMIVGQSRLGTILKCASGGTTAMLDARVNRDGQKRNTVGSCEIRNLSLDANGFARSACALYGGSCILKNAEIYGSRGDGLIVEYVLKTTIENVTVRDNMGNGIIVGVDQPLHRGDVNTSIKMVNIWAKQNRGWGLMGSNINYCAFDNVTTQENGAGGIFLDGAAGGLNAVSNVLFNNCASEKDAGPAYMLKALRNVVLHSVFLLSLGDRDAIVMENCLGELRAITDQYVRKNNSVSLRVVNPVTLGGIVVAGCYLSMAQGDLKFCSFQNAIINNKPLNSLNNLVLNSASDDDAIWLALDPADQGPRGMSITTGRGNRLAKFLGAGGCILSTAVPGSIAPAALNPRDMHVTIENDILVFRVRDAQGVMKSGRVKLFPDS